VKRKWEFNRQEISDILAQHVRDAEGDQTMCFNVVAHHVVGGRVSTITVIEIPKKKDAKP